MDVRAAAAVKPTLEMGRQEQRRAQRPSVKLTQQQLEAHLWGAANILRGKTAGQDYKNYILSLMFYKRLCDQWENEADEAIAELERQQSRIFTDAQKAVFRARGEHRYSIPDSSRWGDVLAASTNLGETLTQAMRAVSNANEELRGVFTVDWAQPAPDLGSRKWKKKAASSMTTATL
jgi:type I restriction enzyme M protein